MNIEGTTKVDFATFVAFYWMGASGSVKIM
jgi:hypothetical protein